MQRKLSVIQIVPKFVLAGAEVMVENLAAALIKDSFDVSIVSLYDYHSAITERLENLGIPILYLGKKKGFDLTIIFKLYKIFKKARPDVIHTHLYLMPFAIPAAILARVPVSIHTIHNIANKEVGKHLRKLYAFFYRYCKVIPVSISPLVKKSVMEEYRFSDEQVPMIYNGIDLNKCIPKEEYEGKNSKINILHVGRFSEQKNHLGLIESFKIVHDEEPNTVLKLIGCGILESAVTEKVKELNLVDCVEFLGMKATVYPYFNKADIFVLPSKWEGMPITLIEAMATGLPIVAASVGGVPDMIENNVTGILVDTQNENIADALITLIKNRKLRQELGEAARTASSKFSVEAMEGQYAKLYRNSLV